MSKVYIIRNDGITEGMPQIKCKDEDRELQRLLDKNYDLLPGEQIRPEEARRWLLVKREMPVPDPGTGGNRWNIDFFFVDQGGMPTFVECKRFQDTRSRREVVGQMLEYAANGHHYWTKDVVRDFLDQGVPVGATIDEVVRTFNPETGDSVDEFLDLIENNLREGQIRLIFFLEKAPYELKSIVDFLNKQMERTEVLIVEAKQYEKDGMRVLVPSLFGYTEQARRVKKSVTVVTPGRRKWNERDFFEAAEAHLANSELAAVRRLYDFVISEGYEIRWGTGKQTGSFSVLALKMFQKSVISVFTDGRMWLNFGWLRGTDSIEEFRSDFAKAAEKIFGISLPSDLDSKYPSLDIKDWSPKLDEFINLGAKGVGPR